MGKVFDAFKNLLIEGDNEENKETKEENDTQEQKNNNKELEKKAKPVIEQTPKIDTGRDTESLSHKLIQKAMANTGDYARFADMLESLHDMIPDERMCYKAAFIAVNKIFPITVQGLAESLGNGIKALDGEMANFQNTLRVREENINKLRTQVQEKNDQILRLQNEIKELMQKIDEEVKKNEQVGISFDRAIKSAKYNIESLVTKLNSYLGG